MAMWQLVLMILFVVTPLVLLVAFHRDRERLNSRGAPLPRDWTLPSAHAVEDEEHH